MKQERLRVAGVQAPLVWQDPEANFAYFERALARIGEADLVLLPEMFSTGFTMTPAEVGPEVGETSLAFLLRMARQYEACFGGSCVFHMGEGRYVNRFFIAYPDGKAAHYDKRHRFAMAGEHEAYSPGDEQPVMVEVRGWRVLLQVCYDLRFPVFSRNQTDEPYDIIAYVANWPAPRRSHWRTLLQARAIENQSYVVGVNRVGQDDNALAYVGDSLIVGPAGEVLADARDAESVIAGELHAGRVAHLREKLPFLRDADAFRLV